MGKEIELAIVFADVVGSTKLYELLGDLRARDMVGICIEVMRAAGRVEERFAMAIRMTPHRSAMTSPTSLRSSSAKMRWIIRARISASAAASSDSESSKR